MYLNAVTLREFRKINPLEFKKLDGMDDNFASHTPTHNFTVAASSLHATRSLSPFTAQRPTPLLRHAEESQLRTDLVGIHIAQCERTLYFVNVLHEIQATKKGPPFGEPFQTAQQSGFCLVGAIGLEPTTPTMSR